MAHPRNRYSDRQIRALGPGRHADGYGLYLNVTESGFRQWNFRWQEGSQGLKGGKVRRHEMGLGGFPAVTLAEARDLALKYRRIVRAGGDPFAERAKSLQGVPAFEEAARTVHTEYSPSWKNEKHRAQWLSTLDEYVFPLIGTRPVNMIQSSDLLQVLGPIWLTKPETARRVKQRISAVMDWSKTKGYRTDNPVLGVQAGLPKQSGTKGHHKAMAYTGVPAFVDALRNENAEEPTRLAFEFLILTASRTSEVLQAPWQEFDLADKSWSVPAKRMKGGKLHEIPLANRCIEILERAKELTGGKGYVFAVNGQPLSNMALLMMLRRMGHDVTAHGMRSSFRDWAAERTNFPREVCEAALAHAVENKVEGAYRRTTFYDKRLELMSLWSDFVTGQNAKVTVLHSSSQAA